VVKSISETNPDIRFLALSVSDAPEDVIAMIRAGCRGYVTKSISPSELADAIRRVDSGDAVFSPSLAGFVLEAFSKAVPIEEDPELDQLTPREKEVLRQIARGYQYKQVCLRGPPKAPALQPPRARPLGIGPPHRLIPFLRRKRQHSDASDARTVGGAVVLWDHCEWR